jgi:hypothetical protein
VQNSCREDPVVDLSTTNVLLGIMAAVSLLQALGLVALFLAGWIVVRRLLRVLQEIEARQIQPAATRVNAILDDVREVTSTVKSGVDNVGGSFGWLLRLARRAARE